MRKVKGKTRPDAQLLAKDSDSRELVVGRGASGFVGSRLIEFKIRKPTGTRETAFVCIYRIMLCV